MFQRLVNHNDDIRRLVERGYAVAFDNKCMIIRDIPYVDAGRSLQLGAIVTKLEFINEAQVTQQNHQVYFAGGSPHDISGKPIPNLGDHPASLALGNTCGDVVVQRIFSNKPKKAEKFTDFYEKIESYVSLISGPAIELHGATPYTFNAVKEVVEYNTIFKIHDTLSSLAEINDLSNKLKDEVIALIGLGGTGAYLLDFFVKTPVREIRSFDSDSFHVHNVFRSPGRMNPDELGKKKATIYQSRYGSMRNGLIFMSKQIDETCKADLEGVTFAFVCVDKGSSRREIFNLLISLGIPFIDVGMGLNRKLGPIGGQLRTTYYSREYGEHLVQKNLAPLSDGPDNIYKTNIQISELNALNACLAMIKYKQLRGYYLQDAACYHALFEISDMKIIGTSDL